MPPYSSRVPGLCGVLLVFPESALVLCRFFWFPTTVPKHRDKQIGNAKLAISENVCAHGALQQNISFRVNSHACIAVISGYTLDSP